MEERTNNENNSYRDFNRINMIPRAIDDIIRNEKKSFGYINHNILIIFSLLFINNMIKENCIAFFSCYIIKNVTINKEENNNNLNLKIICFLTGCIYLLEILSIFLILPFHKINYSFKIYLIILMSSTVVFMISLSIIFYLNRYEYYLYFPIISLIILANMIIEVISSSYLSYLLPPGWKFFNIRAGALTVYIINIGKIIGCLFCFFSLFQTNLNYSGFTLIITIIYISISIYLYKSNNTRIKPICRIMQQKKLNEYIF